MTIHHPIIGTWQLVSQHTVYPDGRVVVTRGDAPRGVLMYDALGNMSVQLMRTDAHAGDYTDLSRLDTAMEGYHAYFGTYVIDEAAGVIRHHVIGAAYAPYRGTTQVRHYTLDDDTLTLRVEAGTEQRVIVWRRAPDPNHA